jgi:hypothetical protein
MMKIHASCMQSQDAILGAGGTITLAKDITGNYTLQQIITRAALIIQVRRSCCSCNALHVCMCSPGLVLTVIVNYVCARAVCSHLSIYLSIYLCSLCIRYGTLRAVTEG